MLSCYMVLFIYTVIIAKKSVYVIKITLDLHKL